MTDTTAKTFRFSEIPVNGKPISDYDIYASKQGDFCMEDIIDFLVWISNEQKGSEGLMLQAFIRQSFKQMDSGGYYRSCLSKMLTREDQYSDIHKFIVTSVAESNCANTNTNTDLSVFNWDSVDSATDLHKSDLQNLLNDLNKYFDRSLSGQEYAFRLLDDMMRTSTFISAVTQFAKQAHGIEFDPNNSVLGLGTYAAVVLQSDCSFLYQKFMIEFYAAVLVLISGDVEMPLAPCYVAELNRDHPRDDPSLYA